MIKPLTSLRFFFAFFVFLSHLGFLTQVPAMKSIFTNVFSEGFIGVSFFFIILSITAFFTTIAVSVFLFETIEKPLNKKINALFTAK